MQNYIGPAGVINLENMKQGSSLMKTHKIF